MAKMRKTEYFRVILSCLVVFWFICFQGLHAADTLTVGQTMRDWEFLESPNKLFRLLFCDLGVSNLRYLGIKDMRYSSYSVSGEDPIKLVWVANRRNPLSDTSGILNITVDGNLVLTDSSETFITISAGQPAISSNTSATLLDSGNLVLRSGERILWQSFDYPSDTWLPGMKIGIFDLNTGQPQYRFLTSFVSQRVPTLGTFTFGVDPNNTKQLVIWQRGVLYWRSGMWNGYNFNYFPDESFYSYSEYNFSYFSNESHSYFTYTRNDKLSSWIQMGSSGDVDIFEVNSDMSSFSPVDLCRPADELTYMSAGCAAIEPSNCKSGDAFNKIQGAMDSWNFSSDNFSLGIADCKEMCRRDCSCKAYGSASSDGSGCKFSSGQKLDFYEEVLYIRIGSVVATESSTFAPAYPPMSVENVEYFHPTNMDPNNTPRKRPLWLMIGAPVVSVCILILVSLLCYLRWRNRNFAENSERSKAGSGQGIDTLIHDLGNGLAARGNISNAQMLELSRTKDHRELPLFSLSSIEIATDHFSAANTIGRGGFGPVYKGKLANGQDIAVKRLSRNSQQGLVEFKNEVILISKLQHRNLVRLLGCCIEGEERILIYEYLPNKSLDSFLFDATKRALLGWKLRLCIIEGIAQGILYLHKYSRLRIIHRDLKTSNILLDSEMNPKISDFGTARVFQENESRANTNRIVGTYGYMSPEYAMDGLFSIKSDVFSFGVMMLEILSGKRNILSFHYSDRSMNLLGYAWELWIEGRSLELMDSALADSWPRIESMRCVQIGLLCVQESAAEDRPTMSQVLSMLTNESVALPTPKQRPLAAIASANNATLPENPELFSVNMLTVTEVEAQ